MYMKEYHLIFFINSTHPCNQQSIQSEWVLLHKKELRKAEKIKIKILISSNIKMTLMNCYEFTWHNNGIVLTYEASLRDEISCP